MPHLNCCGFGRTVSPDPSPIRLVDTSQPKARFALSSHSITPVEGLHNEPVRTTPPTPPEDNGPRDLSVASGHDVPSLLETEDGIRRRHSSRKLHGIAGKVRKKMSRDSEISRQSSKRATRTSLSFEDTDRRAELKRALHQRVKDSLLDDSTVDDDKYDEDAVPIKTPAGTLGRHEGTIQISPRYLNEVLRRSNPPSRYFHTEHHQLERSEASSTNDTTVALSRMLTQRGSRLREESENRNTVLMTETPKKSYSRKKYIFEEDGSPKVVSRTRSPSLLGRSSTVIRSISANKLVEPGLLKPPLLYTPEVPPSPDKLAPQTSSITDTLAADPWRAVPSETNKTVLPATLGHSSRLVAAGAISSVVYDTRIRPASESWLHGASGLLGPSAHMRSRSSGNIERQADHGHPCDPDNEESNFGGIDGKEDSPPLSIYYTARERNLSEGHELAGYAHIYNVHVPPYLASQSNLASTSYPQLQERRRQRSFSGGESGAFHAEPRRQTSSSGIMNPSVKESSSGLSSPGAPVAWDNFNWRATSSVYSSQPSQPRSLLSSQQNSLRGITTLRERLHHRKGSTPSGDVINVPPSRAKSIDLDNLEQQTIDTEYHSSNESLKARELAAAETRIVSLPRANTLPKHSRFKEDLEQISAEIARTNPFRRRVTTLDGGSEWNRASQAVFDNQATSIWEKALREHSQEDAALSYTRLGSNSPGPLDHEVNRRSTSARKPSQRPSLEGTQKDLSVEDWQGTHLQAHLAAYKLPSHAEESETKRPIKAIKPSASIPSTSSWTRYPSHTRSERSMSPAGELDQVYIRDFANMTPVPTTERQHSAKSKESASPGRRMLSSIKQTYRTQTQELHRKLADEARGHRSSVSEGGVLEYPELELLGPTSPPFPSPDIDARLERETVVNKMNQPEAFAIDPNPHAKHDSSEEGARGWLKLYADCVQDPGVCDAPSSAVGLSRSVSEEIGPSDVRVREVGLGGGSGSGSGSSELRASTLDFKRSLELNEEKARQRVMDLTPRKWEV